MTLGDGACYLIFSELTFRQRVYCVTHSCTCCNVLKINDQFYLEGTSLDVRLGYMIALYQEVLCD